MLNYYRDLIAQTTSDTMVVPNHMFGTLRNGDLVAVCNVIEHLRQRDSRPSLRFNIDQSQIHDISYCREFVGFLSIHAGYFTSKNGDQLRASQYPINVWDYRGGVGDLLEFDIQRSKVNKLCIFPIWDAPYNSYRNWDTRLSNEIFERFRSFEGERIVCTHHDLPRDIDFTGYTQSRDLLANIEHLMSCSEYVGGDTGMSHFAGALKARPLCHYYLSGLDSRLHTMPINFLKGCKIVMY